ncbi:MAG: hypothetical protein AAGJ46_09425 [Planctomycetota bacterium]
MTPAACRSIAVIVMLLFGLSTAVVFAQDEATQDAAGERLERLLEEVEWAANRRAALTTDDAADLLQIALRLDRVAGLLAEAADGGESKARRMRVQVTSVRELPLDTDEQSRLEIDKGWLCEATIEPDTSKPSVGAEAVMLVTLDVPSAWNADGVLPQPIEAIGLLVGADQRLLIVPKIEWRPKQAGGGVSFGMSLLGDLGMDVGLLDAVEDARPLRAGEHDLFYGVLNAVGEIGAHQLARFAAGNLDRFASTYAVDAEGVDATLAKVVRARASEGEFAVAPLFNNPAAHRGELMVFDGIVRRALRIDTKTEADGEPARAAEVFGVDHYYELQLFTPDSQNLPLVFCVRDLPEGFHVGEKLQQPARLAGFFLKRWAYRTRIPKQGDRSADKRQVAPLLVGRSPLILVPPAGPSAQTGLIAGGVFVLLLLALSIGLWRMSRGDQAFEDQIRTRLAEAPEQAAGDLDEALDALRGEDREK